MHHHNPLEVQEIISTAFQEAMTYAEYHVLVENHAQTLTSTGHNPPESYVQYTVLNERRMKRWDKVFKINEEHKAKLRSLPVAYNCTVITESWCGDAPPSMAVVNRFAEVTDNLELRVILRDENMEVMNAISIDGKLSIPKFIIQEKSSGTIRAIWGSRPKILQDMFDAFKEEHGAITPQFREEMQKWYNKDKGKEIARELIHLL